MATKLTRKLQEIPSKDVNCLALERKFGRRMVTGGKDNKVNVWAVGKPNLIVSLSGHTSPVEAVRFGITEETVVAGSASGALKIWDTQKAKVVQTLPGHKSAIRSFEFNPMGVLLASGSVDKTVKLWDTRSKESNLNFQGHTDTINCVRFSHDGYRIASAAEDGLLKVWDLRMRNLLADCKGHSGAVTSCEFHPKGNLLASGSADKTVKFWDLGSITEEKCQLIGTTDFSSRPARCILFHPEDQILFNGTFDHLKVYGWEPMQCYNTVKLGWGDVSDIALVKNHLIGATFSKTKITTFMLDITKCGPKAKTGSKLQKKQRTDGQSPQANKFTSPPDEGVSQTSNKAILLHDLTVQKDEKAPPRLAKNNSAQQIYRQHSADKKILESIEQIAPKNKQPKKPTHNIPSSNQQSKHSEQQISNTPLSSRKKNYLVFRSSSMKHQGEQIKNNISSLQQKRKQSAKKSISYESEAQATNQTGLPAKGKFQNINNSSSSTQKEMLVTSNASTWEQDQHGGKDRSTLKDQNKIATNKRAFQVELTSPSSNQEMPKVKKRLSNQKKLQITLKKLSDEQYTKIKNHVSSSSEQDVQVKNLTSIRKQDVQLTNQVSSPKEQDVQVKNQTSSPKKQDVQVKNHTSSPSKQDAQVANKISLSNEEKTQVVNRISTSSEQNVQVVDQISSSNEPGTHVAEKEDLRSEDNQTLATEDVSPEPAIPTISVTDAAKSYFNEQGRPFAADGEGMGQYRRLPNLIDSDDQHEVFQTWDNLPNSPRPENQGSPWLQCSICDIIHGTLADDIWRSSWVRCHDNCSVAYHVNCLHMFICNTDSETFRSIKDKITNSEKFLATKDKILSEQNKPH